MKIETEAQAFHYISSLSIHEYILFLKIAKKLYKSLPKEFNNRDELKHKILPKYVPIIKNIFNHMNRIGGNMDYFKRKMKHHLKNIGIQATMRGDYSKNRDSLTKVDKVYADFANISYMENRPKTFLNYTYDDLSDPETSIYRNDENKHVVISHRGTKSIDDVLTDLRVFQKEEKHKIERFKRAEQKVDAVILKNIQIIIKVKALIH